MRSEFRCEPESHRGAQFLKLTVDCGMAFSPSTMNLSWSSSSVRWFDLMIFTAAGFLLRFDALFSMRLMGIYCHLRIVLAHFQDQYDVAWFSSNSPRNLWIDGMRPVIPIRSIQLHAVDTHVTDSFIIGSGILMAVLNQNFIYNWIKRWPTEFKTLLLVYSLMASIESPLNDEATNKIFQITLRRLMGDIWHFFPKTNILTWNFVFSLWNLTLWCHGKTKS